MIVLGVETSTARSSVAVLAVDADGDDPVVLATAANDDPRGHGAFLAPAIATVCADAGLGIADLDGIAVGTGPGLYTGLRIGLATAAALAWARGVPVAGVGGLDAVVLAARRRPELAAVPLVAVLDARRGQWFHGTALPGGGPVRPAVGDAAAVAAAVAAAGPGARTVGEPPDGGPGGGPGGGPLRPDAADTARLAVPALRAGGTDPAALAPVYLREADVRIGWAARGGGRTVAP